MGAIKRVCTALSPIFSTAVKKELLLKNPVTHATMPGLEPKEKEFLDVGQCRELRGFLHEMTNPQLPRAIELLLYTGGARWRDFAACRIKDFSIKFKY